ncbi:unnamed protein product [Leptosia nina]|uniref:Bromo domain-containing protein n=1 Tax=Leptosia nina TaxID=320188 RepID=A0AAV1JXQ2_9NEOP
MSSIQERLQLKRVPLDTWNTREQLCLASAVVRSGDQNWMSVSRALKTIAEPNRPQDWYSQKSCAVQYGALLEHVDTPKRKKRNSEGGVETPQESILKRLTEQRLQEIQKNIAEMNSQYEQLKNEINEVRNPATSEQRLQEMWADIEASKRARERENARRVAWLKEREENRLKAEKAWRPHTVTSPVQASSPSPSSPLLSSLLKSTPVVTTPQHILHPNSSIETISPSAGAPTLSSLLEQPQDTKHAAIEHIKSQLVQIEHQLKASTSGSPIPATVPPPITAVAPASAPAVDIDDIEIKAEDVYAFRDIDIHIPPVAAMHKGPRSEKQFKKEEDHAVEAPAITPEEKIETEIHVGEGNLQNVETTHDVDVVESMEIETAPEVEEEVTQETEVPKAPEVKIAFPEVKFPTTEIKVIESDDVQIKEEMQPKIEQAQKEIVEVEKTEKTEIEVVRDAVPVAMPQEEIVEEPEPIQPVEVEDQKVDEPAPETPDTTIQEVATNIQTEDIPLPPESPQKEAANEIEATETEAAKSPEPEIVKEEVAAEVEDIPLPEVEVKMEKQEEEMKDEDADMGDSIPLKEIKEEILQEKEILEEAHTETDDDTPMELSREEEKDGKTKRDYSRKKKPDSRTCSGSESAPDSPSSSEAERQHRLWKKSVMLVYSRLCAHKYASLFLRPITDEEAPGYSAIVKRPMDLSTIRKNIDAGHIRTTAQFQRDVLLMLSNALMYNSSSHSVYTMAKDMFEEAQCQLGMLLAAQAHAGLVTAAAPPTRKRRPQSTNPNSPSQFKSQRI